MVTVLCPKKPPYTKHPSGTLTPSTQQGEQGQCSAHMSKYPSSHWVPIKVESALPKPLHFAIVTTPSICLVLVNIRYSIHYHCWIQIRLGKTLDNHCHSGKQYWAWTIVWFPRRQLCMFSHKCTKDCSVKHVLNLCNPLKSNTHCTFSSVQHCYTRGTVINCRVLLPHPTDRE